MAQQSHTLEHIVGVAQAEVCDDQVLQQAIPMINSFNPHHSPRRWAGPVSSIYKTKHTESHSPRGKGGLNHPGCSFSLRPVIFGGRSNRIFRVGEGKEDWEMQATPVASHSSPEPSPHLVTAPCGPVLLQSQPYTGSYYPRWK